LCIALEITGTLSIIHCPPNFSPEDENNVPLSRKPITQMIATASYFRVEK
jgi:hypothetical protein